MQGHKNAVLELHWSSDCERIVSASPDKTVRAWDIARGVQIKKMGEHADVVNSCHLLPKGAPLLVSGSEDACIKVWSLCCAVGPLPGLWCLDRFPLPWHHVRLLPMHTKGARVYAKCSEIRNLLIQHMGRRPVGVVPENSMVLNLA